MMNVFSSALLATAFLGSVEATPPVCPRGDYNGFDVVPFTPILLDESAPTLKLDGTPVINFVFELDINDLDPTFVFAGCDTQPTGAQITSQDDTTTCTTDWTVQVAYADDCNWSVTTEGGNVVLSSEVELQAEYITYEFQGELVRQSRSRPMKFQLSAPISLSTESAIVTLTNSRVCPEPNPTSPECNGQECLESGQCECDTPNSGLDGQTCDDDVEAPVFTECKNDTTILTFTGPTPANLSPYPELGSITVVDNVDTLEQMTIARWEDGIQVATGSSALDIATWVVDANERKTFQIIVSDRAGNIAKMCELIIELNDIEDPVPSCPPATIQNSLPFSLTATAEDNVLVTDISDDGDLAFPAGVYASVTVTYTALDAAGNDGTCTTLVRYDPVDPVLTCNDLTLPIDTDVNTVSLTQDMTPTVSDDTNAPISITNNGNDLSLGASYSCSDAAACEFVFSATATDEAGNSGSCDGTIRIEDVQDPDLQCLTTPLSVSAATNETYADLANADQLALSYSDAVGVEFATWASADAGFGTQSLSSGGRFQLGTNTATITITDYAGNFATCTVTVVVTDDQLPVVTCPDDMILNNFPGSSAQSHNAPGVLDATDNDGLTLNINDGTTDYGPGASISQDIADGTVTYTFTATDPSNNVGTCSYTVTVIDNEAPTFTCPTSLQFSVEANSDLAFISIDATTGIQQLDGLAGSAVGAPISLGSSDNYNNVGELSVYQCDSGSCDNLFPDTTYQITVGFPTAQILSYTLKDAAGNEGLTCTLEVTVVDPHNPALTCPTGATLETNTGSTTGTLPLAYSYSDNDEVSSVSLTIPSSTYTTNTEGATSADYTAELAPGSYDVTMTVSDPSGNPSDCTVTFVIEGKCGDALLTAGEECEIGYEGCSSTCTCEMGYEAATPVDFNCKKIIDPEGCDDLPNTSFCPLTNRTVNYLAKDYNPRSTCDDEEGRRFALEVFELPSNTPVVGELEAGDWIQIELCPEGAPFSNVLELFHSLDGALDPWTNVEATCEAINGAGNYPESEFNATSGCYTFFTCTTGPEFTTGTPTDQCGALFQCTGEDITVTGTTDPYVVTWVDADRYELTAAGVAAEVTPTFSTTSGSSFALASTTEITISATDGVTTTTCSFNVIVLDGLEPVITGCPTADITVGTDFDQGYATLPQTYLLGGFSALDSVDGVVTVTLSGQSGNNQYAVGTHSFTYTAVDVAGNTATCPATWIVEDDQDPDVDCIGTVALNTDNDESFATFTADLTSLTITTGDNYDTALTCSFSGLLAQYPLGDTVVTYTCTDDFGNSGQCPTTITVTDNQAPDLSCAPLTLPIGRGEAPYTISDADFRSGITASDNVAITGENVPNLGPFSAPWDFPHAYTLVYSVADAEGNGNTCSFQVTFTDAEDPTPACPAAVSLNVNAVTNLDAQLLAEVSSSDYDTDGAATTQDHTGDIADFDISSALVARPNTVLYTFTDPTGNSDTCTFPVTLVDDEDPVLTCPDITVYLSGNGYEAAWTLPSATDNLGTPTILQTAGIVPGATLQLGANAMVVTATDRAGNVATCSFDVILEDDLDPTLDCGSIAATYELLSTEGSHVLDYTLVQASYSDDTPILGDVSVTVNGVAYTEGLLANLITLEIGANELTFTATDSSGNANTGGCSATITVLDNIDPTLSCANITVRSTNDLDTAIVTWSVSPDDNVEVASTVSTPVSGSTFSLGDTQVDVTVTDTSSNTATCTFTVTVLPAFPIVPTYEAIVDVMQAVNIAGDDYGADIIFRTGAEWPYTVSVVGTQDADILQLVEAPAYKASNCPEDEFVGDCYQQFNARVLFESCDVNTTEHVFRMQADCVHGGCELSSFQFDLELFITINDNLCEAEDLGDITITATMTTHTPSVRIAWEDAGADLTAVPASQTIFNSDELVAAIIAVRTDALQVNGVTIRNATKTYYSDSALTAQIETVSLVDGFAISAPADSPTTLPSNGADFATFQVFNQDIPLDTTVFTKFEATVDVEYRLRADDTVVRRRLLNFQGFQDASTGDINMVSNNARSLLQAEDALSDSAACDSDYMLSAARSDDAPGADCTTVIMSLLGDIPATATTSELEGAVRNMLMGLLGASADELKIVILTHSTAEITVEVSVCGDNARVHAGLLGALIKGPGLGDASLFIGSSVIPVDSDPSVFFVTQNDDDGVTPNGSGDPNDPSNPAPPVADEDGPPVVIIAAAAAGVIALGSVLFCFFLYKRRKNEDNEEKLPNQRQHGGASLDSNVNFHHPQLMAHGSASASSSTQPGAVTSLIV